MIGVKEWIVEMDGVVICVLFDHFVFIYYLTNIVNRGNVFVVLGDGSTNYISLDSYEESIFIV